MYNNRIRNIELPENLFSNLGELKSKKMEPKTTSSEIKSYPTSDTVIREYKMNAEQKLTNYANKKEYRDRMNRIYEDIKEIKPIDNEIDNVLYFNHYIEKGIVIKPKVSSLKQFWTEYRLISNEKQNTQDTKLTTEKSLDNFDELFEALSIRVSEINKYIDELKEMKKNIDISSNQLEEDKEKLSEERKTFLNYKKEQESKLKEENETLKINFAKLQTIIDDLDKKLESIDKE